MDTEKQPTAKCRDYMSAFCTLGQKKRCGGNEAFCPQQELSSSVLRAVTPEKGVSGGETTPKRVSRMSAVGKILTFVYNRIS